MAWVGVITNAGNLVLGQWLSGSTCNIVSAAGGRGTVKEAALLAQTEVSEQQQTASLVSCQKVEGGYKLRLQFAAADTEYTLKQIGIWANVDGGEATLLAIYQDEVGVTIRSKSDFPDFAYTFFGVLAIGNTGQLSVNIDASANITYATLQEALEDYVQLDSAGKIPDDVLPDMDFIPKTARGQAGGVASLNTSGKIPIEQLAIDTALSATSGNPVQNKIVQAALADKAPASHGHTAVQIGAVPFVGRSLSLANFNDPNYPTAYEGSIEAGWAATLGLPYAWWHLHFFRHMDNNGYGCQIAFPLDNSAGLRARFRCSTGTTWGAWRELYDSLLKPSPADIGAAAAGHGHDIASLGGCRIVTGQYTGNDAYREASYYTGTTDKAPYSTYPVYNGDMNALTGGLFINLGGQPKMLIVGYLNGFDSIAVVSSQTSPYNIQIYKEQPRDNEGVRHYTFHYFTLVQLVSNGFWVGYNRNGGTYNLNRNNILYHYIAFF